MHVSATKNVDLVWALRGAGANFGVVTSFEYRLHPVGLTVLGGMVVHPLEAVREVLRFYRDVVTDRPDELTTYVAILNEPDWTPVIAMVACYAGSLEDGERAVTARRQFGRPLANSTSSMSTVAMYEECEEAQDADRCTVAIAYDAGIGSHCRDV